MSIPTDPAPGNSQCNLCGAAFEAQRGTARWCSSRCRQAAYRRRAKGGSHAAPGVTLSNRTLAAVVQVSERTIRRAQDRLEWERGERSLCEFTLTTGPRRGEPCLHRIRWRGLCWTHYLRVRFEERSA